MKHLSGNTAINYLLFKLSNVYGGFLQQLTTPEVKFDKSVFPGSNWFYYWRTSASLWQGKLSEYTGPKPVFVPINWSLHSEINGQFDFGQIKPECDLKRLEDTAKELGIEVVFLLPVSPAPFMVNGGVPSYLARNPSINRDGMNITVVDDLNSINKVYSFYDTETFQSFRKFSWNLGQYISQLGLSSSIYGLESFRLEDGHHVSYFKDDGASFDTGFNRYVKQLQDSEPEKINALINDKQFELQLKQEFSSLIKNLYIETAKEFLAGNWLGVIKTSLIGGSTLDIFRRTFSSWESEQDYFLTLSQSISSGYLPFSPIVNNSFSGSSLSKSIEDLIDTPLITSFLESNLYSDDDSLNFRILFFFEIFDTPYQSLSIERVLEKCGLNYYFKKNFPANFKIQDQLNHEFEELNERTIHFFFGEKITEKSFNYLLKLFMNGHKIFLDTSHIGETFKNKLHVFFTENNLNIEKLNFVSIVEKASLGEGSIITYESESLLNVSLIKRAEFWDSMINYLDVKHLSLDTDDDLYYFWRARSSNTYELNYEEIRRVNFYNPTSYKKKAHIKSSQNFAFIKAIDQQNVDIKSTPIGIDLIFQPGSNITLDFGFYE